MRQANDWAEAARLGLTRVAIAGVGMHPFGRFPDISLKELAAVAVLRALDDAGLSVRDVEAVYSANAMAGLLQGQEQVRGQVVLQAVGIEGVPIVNVENACASGSTAFRQAILAIQADAASIVLAVGFEKMFVSDLSRSLDALETAADVDVVGGLGLQFTALYAMRLRLRLEEGSLQPHHLVDVSVKSHDNGALNPYAQFRRPVSSAEVERSRPIAEPLRLLMCSSISDGAAAIVLTRADRIEDGRPNVVVRASATASGFTASTDTGLHTSTVCARKAYELAGCGPEEIDLAEVHDAMAPGELLCYEQLDFCGAGEGGAFLDNGHPRLSGRMPVNPSGGLSSRGHPVGATGLAQIAELTWQLRGEAGARQVRQPRLALAHNTGGWLNGEPAACNVHILERLQPWN